jgi:CheY-like chemotaxis protein
MDKKYFESRRQSQQGRILVVDDDEKILKVFSDMLTPNGYEVVTAKNGAEGINLARNELPGLILMDIMMPEIDGYTACSVLKKDDKTKKIPLIMVTGIGFELNKRLSEQLDADGYLVKPVSIDTLLDTVNRFFVN